MHSFFLISNVLLIKSEIYVISPQLKMTPSPACVQEQEKYLNIGRAKIQPLPDTAGDHKRMIHLD